MNIQNNKLENLIKYKINTKNQWRKKDLLLVPKKKKF